MPWRTFLSFFCSLSLAATLLAGEKPAAQPPKDDPAEQLKSLESKIKKTPADPMLYYRKAQTLMKLKKYEEGYQTAKTAMKRFIAQKNDLAWMLLEQIDCDHVRIDVHFNMGEKERKPPKIGIVTPLSFRVWTKDKDPKLLEVIDFELGMLDGKPMTAAFGQSTDQMHANFDMVDPQAKYEEIRKKALKLIEKRHPKSS